MVGAIGVRATLLADAAAVHLTHRAIACARVGFVERSGAGEVALSVARTDGGRVLGRGASTAASIGAPGVGAVGVVLHARRGAHVEAARAVGAARSGAPRRTEDIAGGVSWRGGVGAAPVHRRVVGRASAGGASSQTGSEHSKNGDREAQARPSALQD
jgi:hypothetical protein